MYTAVYVHAWTHTYTYTQTHTQRCGICRCVYREQDSPGSVGGCGSVEAGEL